MKEAVLELLWQVIVGLSMGAVGLSMGAVGLSMGTVGLSRDI